MLGGVATEEVVPRTSFGIGGRMQLSSLSGRRMHGQSGTERKQSRRHDGRERISCKIVASGA